MERVLRYVLSLFVGLIGLIAGGLLIWMAIANSVLLWGVYKYATAESGLAHELRVAEEKLKGVKFDLDKLIQPALLAVLALSAGVFLLIIGGRSLFRRLMAGLPEENEGRAETAVGRWGHIAIYLFGILLAGKGLVFGILYVPTDVPLTFTSVHGEATAEKHWSVPSEREGARPSYYAVFRYTTADGQSYRKEMQVDSIVAAGLKRDPDIRIAYVPNDPQNMTIARWVRSPLGYLWFFMWRIVFVTIGVRGIARELRPPDGGSKVNVQPLSVSVGAPPAESRTGLRRKQFGRRT
ncbi:hypothetical protein [Roseibium aggregatum]|uniref:DUF3592 domain-containing protein n=1 Tax=Roseibium aggregatum TaxID=187304 RepID=A0A926S416_9HYPH|nr:hypothetical protein [Roseibium aggregatum]MBD1545888.1 hypothetical protein [Roseibium aggregatum]